MKQTFAALALAAVASTTLFAGPAHAAPSAERATSSVLTKKPEPGSTAIEGLWESIAMFVCPLTEESSVAWTRMAMNDFDSPDARLFDFVGLTQHTVVAEGDTAFDPIELPAAPRTQTVRLLRPGADED